MPQTGRNLHIDNIKAVLIFLVVFGHLIEMNIGHDSVIRSVWMFLYFFHMPMFAFVSGMFSKASLNETQSLQLAKNVVIPLVAFELLYEGLEIATTGAPSNYFSLFAPYWLLWYLFSLLCWRLMLTVFSKIRFPLTIAIALSLVISYSDNTGYFLSISRTLTFFPFFFLGWKLGDGFLAASGTKMKLANIAVLAIALGAISVENSWDYRWLYGSYSLASLDMANLTGVLYQLLLYALSTVIGLSFINLITRRDIGIAAIGQNSLHVYLWHGFAVIGLSQIGILDSIFELNGIAAMAVLALISAGILIIASHRWCVAFTNKCIFDPLAKLLLREGKNKPALSSRV